MAKRRKSTNVFGSKKRTSKQSDSFVIGVVFVVVLIGGAISLIPAWVWGVLGGLLLLGALGYLFQTVKKGSQATLPPAATATSHKAAASVKSTASIVPGPSVVSTQADSQSINRGNQTAAPLAPKPPSDLTLNLPMASGPIAVTITTAPRSAERKIEVPVTVNTASSLTASPEHRLPPPPNEFASLRWIPAGQPIDIAGLRVREGLVYFGIPPRQQSNPAWIDPSKRIATAGDYRERLMGYWPSYSEISPEARRAYITWLSEGRSDPEADIGYVFLYYYGLEQRALIDARHDAAAKAELVSIAEELKRLLDIYGAKSSSFRNYAGSFYELLTLENLPDKLYQQPIPSLPKSYEVPIYIRLALGMAAVDRAPVHPGLARAWVKHSPTIYLRTPALRCSTQFDQLFDLRYVEKFGVGLVLPHNKTKLKFMYRPASAALMSHTETALSFGDIPDVTAVTKPIQRLAELAETVTKELEAYSRYLGKNPDAENALEALLLLPPVLWPESSRQSIEGIKSRIGDGMLVVSFQDLLKLLNARATLTKDKAVAMVRVLESQAIGVEPNILEGARLPKPDEKVALFAIPLGEANSQTTPAYQAAVLTLQVASTVAAADGDFSAHEMNHLRQQIESWTHLTSGHIRRLKAHLRLLIDAPASLPALKKKLEPLDTVTKETLGAFMATVAQADGKVTPDEVKMLEKIYKALGIDSKKVFSDVHAVSTGDIPVAAAGLPAPAAETGFKLDPARIAALQSDTAKVAALLANIFNEDEVPNVIQAEAEVAEPELPPNTGLLGLDEAHSAFARLLLSRPQWTREELQDVASDMELMLDGALERVNDAAYDTHDIPFTEGDDPIEVNAEVLEKIEA